MSMTMQWILAGLMFFVPGAAMITINYYLLIKTIKNSKLPEEERERIPSGAPLYGGLLCGFGILVAMHLKHPWIALIPPILDPGGVVWLIYASIIYRKMK